MMAHCRRPLYLYSTIDNPITLKHEHLQITLNRVTNILSKQLNEKIKKIKMTCFDPG
jgi:hypothetical protein